MKTRRFTLGIGPDETGRRHWMNVVLYGTSEEMRQAAMRHRPTSNPKDMEDAGGCFQCGESSHPTYLGIMRLSGDYLTPEAVIHEAVHAALVYVQKTHAVDRLHLDAWSDGPRIIDNEEALAYSVHGIASALLAELDLIGAP